MPEKENSVLSAITQDVEEHPFFAAVAGIAALLVGFTVFHHSTTGQTTQQSAAQSQPNSYLQGYTGTPTNNYYYPTSSALNGSSSVGSSPPTTSPPTTSPPTTSPPTTSPPTTTTGPVFAPNTFLGPTGVKHYTVQSGDSLSSIASKFGLSSWNSIYAIPDNQKVLGRMNAVSASRYKPKSGTVITLPPNTTI